MKDIRRGAPFLLVALLLIALLGGPVLAQDDPPSAGNTSAVPDTVAPAAGSPADEAKSDEGGSDMLEFSWQGFVFAVVNFLLLCGLLYWLLHKPLLRAIDNRREEVAEGRKQAQEATEQAEAKKHEYEEKLAGIQQERDKELSEARRQAEEDREKLIEKARAEADREVANLRTDWDRQLQEAVDKLQDDVVAVSLFLAKHIVQKLTDETIEQKLDAHLDRELDLLAERADERMRTELFQSEAPVRVVSAHELGDERRGTVREKIETIADAEVRIDFDAQADLIAGTRVEFSSAAIDASLSDVFQVVRDRLEDVAPKTEEKDREDEPASDVANADVTEDGAP